MEKIVKVLTNKHCQFILFLLECPGGKDNPCSGHGTCKVIRELQRKYLSFVIREREARMIKKKLGHVFVIKRIKVNFVTLAMTNTILMKTNSVKVSCLI